MLTLTQNIFAPTAHSPVLRRVTTVNSHPTVVLRRHTSGNFFNPLRSVVEKRSNMGMLSHKCKRGLGTVCYSAPVFTPNNLQWICTVSSAILMFVTGSPIQKSFLVPFFALQAPASLTSWIKGEYGIWTAFLALLVRLIFYIPGELELPFIALMLVIVSPYQITNLRGRQEGVVLSLVIAAFLAFQHFTRVGLRKSFDQGSIIATLAILCIVAVPILFLI